MAGKPWKKSSDILVEIFDRDLLDFPIAERRQMFGCPCAFVNGNMVTGLHEENWMIRLDPAERMNLLAAAGREFAPMGRVMKEYAILPERIVDDPAQRHAWLEKSFKYAASLRKKEKTPKRANQSKPRS